MRGRPRKPADQLQDRRPSRQRDMIAIDMGNGYVWNVPANSLAALSVTTPRAPWREPAPSAKALVARAKPRDERGRFLPVVPGDRSTPPPRPATDTDQLAADLAAAGAEAMTDLDAAADRWRADLDAARP